MKKGDPQPAKLSYFFGPGFKDLMDAVKGTWKSNSLDASNCMKEFAERGIMTVSGAYYLFSAISVAVFGTIFFLCISAVILVVLFVFYALVYTAFTVVWLADRGYLISRRIATACHVCKSKYLIPTYICPECGARHTKLCPGKYGILKRTCQCGAKLPTTFFNGRRDLAAICPVCLEKNNALTYLHDRETRPVCIPVAGARSVGKTAYITAFSHDFIEKTAPEHGLETEVYSDEKKSIYEQMTDDYRGGTTRMTPRAHDVRETSSVSFSFFVKHKNLVPDRLVHIYDIAGEVFTDNEENEIPRHYNYSNGIVLIIDPFSIPTVMSRYGHLLSETDKAGIGRTDINLVVDSFLNKLRMAAGMDDRTMFRTPLAVVISKIDSGGLSEEFSEEKLNEVMKRYEDKKPDRYDAEDFLCRKFLEENEMINFIRIINTRFKYNRYFVCSAIGHSRDDGEYKPYNTAAPIEWICEMSDPRFAALWTKNAISAADPLAANDKHN